MRRRIRGDRAAETKAPACVLPIEEESLRALETAEQADADMRAFFPQLLDSALPQQEVQGKSESLGRAAANLGKALARTYEMQDELNARWRDIRRQNRRRMLPLPANAAVDSSESASAHFAKGLNLYKLLLIFYVGSFAGVVVEMLWCLIRNGYIESRAGLVYGPFNLLYGAGAVALTVCLYRFRNRGSWLSFLGGMVVGSVVEYVCSWGQEMVMGTRSWDYSDMPFNLNGRICLPYSIFWGVLGAMWMKNLYPRIAQLILKIPNCAGKVLTWALAVFFVFNSLMSALSLYRWYGRTYEVPASNAFFEWIDERFPDERMEKIYANMVFLTQ